MNEKMTDILRDFMKDFLEDLHTCLPGAVESYDPKTRTASIVPQMKKRYRSGEELALPVIHSVPVQFSSSRKASISFPLEEGDEGILVFSERSIDEWMESGRAELPEDIRRFALDDAFFIPGASSRRNAESGAADALRIEYGKTRMEMKDSGVSMSFGGIAKVEFSEKGLDITTAAGKYSAVMHKHTDAEGRPTSPPTPG